jgi:hypothetical protein
MVLESKGYGVRRTLTPEASTKEVLESNGYGVGE